MQFGTCESVKKKRKGETTLGDIPLGNGTELLPVPEGRCWQVLSGREGSAGTQLQDVRTEQARVNTKHRAQRGTRASYKLWKLGRETEPGGRRSPEPQQRTRRARASLNWTPWARRPAVALTTEGTTSCPQPAPPCPDTQHLTGASDGGREPRGVVRGHTGEATVVGELSWPRRVKSLVPAVSVK